jgi:hypothetical protein
LYVACLSKFFTSIVIIDYCEENPVFVRCTAWIQRRKVTVDDLNIQTTNVQNILHVLVLNVVLRFFRARAFYCIYVGHTYVMHFGLNVI